MLARPGRLTLNFAHVVIEIDYILDSAFCHEDTPPSVSHALKSVNTHCVHSFGVGHVTSANATLLSC